MILVDLMFVTGFVVLWALYLRMYIEVNRSLPEDRQLKYWQWSWGHPAFYLQHRQLFPHSKLRSAADLMDLIWFPFGVIGFFRIYQAMDRWLAR